MDANDTAPSLTEKSLEWLEFWPETGFNQSPDLNMNSNPFSWAQTGSDQSQQATGSAAPAALSSAQASQPALMFPAQSQAALLGHFSEVCCGAA